MRPDLVVPGEHEEDFIVSRDARVVTVPFSPLEKRFAKEKPQLMPGLKMSLTHMATQSTPTVSCRSSSWAMRILNDSSAAFTILM